MSFASPTSGLAAIMADFSTAVIHKLQGVNFHFGSRGQNQLVLSSLSVAVSLAFVFYVSRSRVAPHHIDFEKSFTAKTNESVPSEEFQKAIALGSQDVAVSNVELDTDEGGIPKCGEQIPDEPIPPVKPIVQPNQPEEETPDTSFESETLATGDVSVSTIDLDLAEGRVQDLVQRGKALARRRQYSDSAAAYSEALSLIYSADVYTKTSPQVAAILQSRSLMYEKDGKYDLALKDCEDLLLSKSSDNRARKRVAHLLKLQHSGTDGAATRSPSFLKNLNLRRSKKGSH